MIAAVYCITNELNGHQYVGASHYVELRMEGHFSELRCGTHHSKKMQKEFNDNAGFYFSCCLLDRMMWDNEVRNKLLKSEREWIWKLDPEYNTLGKKKKAA